MESYLPIKSLMYPPINIQKCHLDISLSLGQFKTFVIYLIESQSFLVMYSVIKKKKKKKVFTRLGELLPPRIIEAIDHSSNLAMAY